MAVLPPSARPLRGGAADSGGSIRARRRGTAGRFPRLGLRARILRPGRPTPVEADSRGGGGRRARRHSLLRPRRLDGLRQRHLHCRVGSGLRLFLCPGIGRAAPSLLAGDRRHLGGCQLQRRRVEPCPRDGGPRALRRRVGRGIAPTLLPKPSPPSARRPNRPRQRSIGWSSCSTTPHQPRWPPGCALSRNWSAGPRPRAWPSRVSCVATSMTSRRAVPMRPIAWCKRALPTP
jgi:hypothetical protein